MTDGEREAILLRIYVRESEEWQGGPLYKAIVEEAQRQGLAGATVLRAIEGFGLRNLEGPEREAKAPGEQPLVIEIVDWEDRIQSFRRTLEKLLTEGLVTAQRVEVASYRSRPSE